MDSRIPAHFVTREIAPLRPTTFQTISVECVVDVHAIARKPVRLSRRRARRHPAADECEIQARTMEHCKVCAEECRRCGHACQELLATIA